MKICICCGIEREDSNFKERSFKCFDCIREYQKEYRNKNKLKAKEYSTKYYEINRESLLEKSYEYALLNKEKISKYKSKNYQENKDHYQEYIRNYYQENKERLNENSKNYRKLHKDHLNRKRNEYNKINKVHKKATERRQKDPLYRMSSNIRVYLRYSIKSSGFGKSKKTEDILGCSFKEFKLYLESKFESWMSWNNYGLYNGELNYGWDIDHIIPLKMAETEDDLYKLNHHTNLQPLCSKINRYVKKDKLLV